MVSLTIDGKDITVAKGATILEAAELLGITIPTLCWLKKVSPTGACRVCAVEVEGVDRPMTACNTPVKDGIAVTTQSEKLSRIRQKIVELLLVNHPLDCPVCDAGGECDLQNSCYGLGASRQEYGAVLERRQIRYDWPLIESDPNRCILCEKCVKVDHEVVGCDAIAVVDRGEATVIDTVDGKPLNCEFCGNCVGVCPTGTLISKPFKFRGRPWAFTVTKSVCAFCAAGCQIEYHTRNGRVERVTSDDGNYNSGNLCINGRFGYSYANSADRLTAPMVRGASSDWNAAMGAAVTGLKEIVAKYGAGAVAGLGSPRVTNEENYLFQKLFRAGIGSSNIDSEARLGFAQAQTALREMLGLTGANATIDAIDQAAAVLVFGCDLNAEATGMEYRVIKAVTKNDAKLVLANPRGVKLKKFANSHLAYRPGSELAVIAALIKLVLEEGGEDADFIARRVTNIAELKASLSSVSVAAAAAASGVSEADLREAAKLLGGKKSVAVIFGADLMRSGGTGEKVRALANLALVLGALGKDAGGLFPVYEKTNIRGVLDMGVAPDHLPGYRGTAAASAFEKAWGRPVVAEAGKDLWQIVEGVEQGTIKALYLLGCDPTVSFPEGGRIRAALEKLELLIVQDPFPGEAAKCAHVLFPSSVAAEKNGTFTTIDGRIQALAKAVNPPGDAREDWDILTELYNRLTGAARPATPAAIMAEIAALVPGYGADVTLPAVVPTGPVTLAIGGTVAAAAPQPYTLLAGAILYHSGSTTTWSANNLEVAPEGYVEIHPADAAKLGVSDGAPLKLSSAGGSVTGKARVSNRVQPGLLFAPYHFRSLNVNTLLSRGANWAGVSVEKG
ncbi:molybdopterin-dependent oxidoreductase [Geobacter pickeringii]|uniref:NADPH-Fe(3+) oxidoreductase subunit alpha n=1 Tax=Geobacter pickeringii TaxID=345632 RepID=A0A0B5BIF0_9BACT|nr:molybdopterin-dependent oxidoreductase [Geobacter pickeringii]AJE04285.1 NADH-ubiquinone oxidoreductase subunit 3 [Geobacter pickeringii]